MRRFSPAKRNFEFLNDADPALRPSVRIIPRAEHSISRSAISPNALRVLYRLREAGYEAFLVGGCVRDLLLGIQPKDFDIATSALPEEVKRTFRNCRLIGFVQEFKVPLGRRKAAHILPRSISGPAFLDAPFV